MRHLVAVPFAGLMLATAVSAQERAIHLPDTLGANFSIADSARARGTAADFDFLLGSWHFTFQTRRPNGTFNPAFTGHWTVTKQAAEHYQNNQQDVQTTLVVDQWRPDDSTSAQSSGTYTYRAFSSVRGIWTFMGINSYEANWEPGLAWSDASNRYLIQHYGTAIVRIRYFAIAGNEFLWRADRSTDYGRTWQLDSWTMQASRIAK